MFEASPDGFAHRRGEIDEGFQMLLQDLVADPGWATMSEADILLKIKDRGGIKGVMKQSLLLFDLAEALKRNGSGVPLDLLRTIQARLSMAWDESGEPREEVHDVILSVTEAFSLWHDIEIDFILE
jgi:hypothetical protein